MFHLPQDCGYPGFDTLRCNSQDLLFLGLPHSGDFLVRDIDYLSQQIQLYDPNDCLPGRLLTLNLSSSPFVGTYYKNYTFLGCSPGLDRSQFAVIDCLSNATMSVLATSSMAFVRAMNSCNAIATVPIPGSWSFQNIGNGFSSDLTNGDLFLSWKVPDCRICEATGRICRLASSSSLDSVCDIAPTYGRIRGRKFIRIIGFSAFLPFVILPALFIGILCCKCFLARQQIRLHQSNIVNASSSNNSRTSSTIIPQFDNNVKTGLDDSTIESCPKVILDENCSNIPRSNDLVCSICLDEYVPKQTLRFIPNCEHYFHVECIDNWLRINSTCPVCRTSPFNFVAEHF
ncbi:hypothetical protein ACH5RR_000080 [Cinchona calisaya]|uniref:RING-type E3 ubiquitin transferase n=1 Tax=Cinchona calisaya TaxID=153742 RepID=A0ABD3AZP5_9GENT